MPTLRPRKRQSEAPAAATPSSSQPKATTSSTSTKVTSSTTPSLKKRTTTRSAKNATQPREMSSSMNEERPLLGDDSYRAPPAEQADVQVSPPPPPESLSWAQRNQWIVFALASGACAAFNGVFAKLTTTELTTKFSQGIARLLGLESAEGVVEFVVRCSFFGLNLAFNGVMWTLFTTALARGNSTTQVSVMNTSSNFVITAMLGFAIFSEKLPPLWWLGAAMLVAGNVIVGRKDEGVSKEGEEIGEEGVTLVSETEGGRSALRPGSGGQYNGALEDDGKDEDEDVADLRI
ncbi:hypothetical protein C8A00DRAFT_29858 [Chaetomidium leptoderma]|uniref:Transmembrane protein 42 n=1 Tax=Chaetomidium leptoderma TaxID=669021 RepID=A0AAN6VTD4_9PEZI|nr:hypothetical protein C8A00DRAFT_29858 [Chaetomidium leptoderma]